MPSVQGCPYRGVPLYITIHMLCSLSLCRLETGLQVLQSLGGSGWGSSVCGHHVCHSLVLCPHHHRCSGRTVHGRTDTKTRYIYIYIYTTQGGLFFFENVLFWVSLNCLLCTCFVHSLIHAYVGHQMYCRQY